MPASATAAARRSRSRSAVRAASATIRPAPASATGAGASLAGGRQRARARRAQLHAAASRREDPPAEGGTRGRAEARDGALRRSRGFDRDRHRAGPGRDARADGRGVPGDPRRGAPLRRNGQSVHRGRRDGALRRADRTRGRAAPRRAGGARHPGGARGLRRPGARPLRPRLSDAHRDPLGAGGGRQDRRRPAHGLHGGRRHDEPRRPTREAGAGPVAS